MSTQAPEEQKKKKRNTEEEGDSFIESLLDLFDHMGCFSLIFLPFRLLWGLIKFIVDIFD